MLENLTQSLTSALGAFRKPGKLSEEDVQHALREVRRALLEADVHFKVAKAFTQRVAEGLGQQARLEGVGSLQQATHAFHAALVEFMAPEVPALPKNPSHPMVLLLAGLQGSGKTTSAAKLGLWMRKRQNRKVLLAACDLQRPGAVDQLVQLGKQLDLDVYSETPAPEITPQGVAERALNKAKDGRYDALIVDSAGRLHVDDKLMAEIRTVQKVVSPDATYLVLDAMTGQDAVDSAQSFAETLDLYGVILTKMDGDARGGAALSVKEVTGVGVSFLGTGEAPQDLEEFQADRLASRILDLGDLVGLVEQAQDVADEKDRTEDYQRMMSGKLSMEDLLDQFKMMRKMGSMKKMLGMLPGAGRMSGLLESVDDGEIGRIEAIILSMTPQERLHPELLDRRRRLRISRGSGTDVSDVNRLYRSFQQMQKQMKSMGRLMGGGRGSKRLLKHLQAKGGFSGMPGFPTGDSPKQN